MPKDSKRKKNTHAWCYHIDLEHDIRSLQSIEPNAEWFFTAHHELGHGHYFAAYTRPDVPPLLRLGANPGFHEGIGELAALASSQVPYLQAKEILPADFKADKTAFLLDDALARSVPFIFFASGTMTHWEADIYAHQLEQDDWNDRWWNYVSEYQGVEPPEKRGEEWADYATKTHINDAPAYYYNYAFATVLKFQLHDYIARKILHQPPQSCNYAGNKEVGTLLNNILKKGGTEDWRKVLKEATGEDLSTRAMVEYFQPLMAWLEEQNKGRKIGWDADPDQTSTRRKSGKNTKRRAASKNVGAAFAPRSAAVPLVRRGTNAPLPHFGNTRDTAGRPSKKGTTRRDVPLIFCHGYGLSLAALPEIFFELPGSRVFA